MTDSKRPEVNTAFVRRHYAMGPTAYDITTGNPLRWPTPADVAYCEQQFDRWLAAHDREVAAKAWHEGYAAVLVNAYGLRSHKVTNPYREGGAS